jgi:hypothetical protein
VSARRNAAALVGATAALAAAAVLVASLHAQPPREGGRNRRVWTGTIDDREIGLNYTDTAPIRRPVRYAHDIHVEFAYVSESDPAEPGVVRWVSRRITWSAAGSSASSITGTDCESSGSIDLGPASSADAITPEQREELTIPCKSWSNTTHFTFIAAPPTTVPRPRIDYGMANCETRRWSTHGVDYTLSVAGDLDASVTVPEGLQSFVPEPGRTLTVSASSNSGPVRFKFELDPAGTSAFPGYATNANVDEAFFVAHQLPHLKEAYANDSPDVIFDRENLSGREWSRREQSVVETARSGGSTSVVLTAMDYGAVGQLRASAKAEGCGDWQPIPVRVGAEERHALSLPQDGDDNLIADALEDYRSLRPDVDEDGDPPGNGMNGDGLTAFEEYRGFMAEGGDCDDPLQLWHTRTHPSHKDLLVVMEPNERGLGLPLKLFEFATGLRTLSICYQNMVDGLYGGQAQGSRIVSTPDSRTINFTLQQARLRAWRGHRISQDEPQHGVLVKAMRFLGGEYGEAAPADPRYFGPPKFTKQVYVATTDPEMMAITLVHEMGHAVGIPHHSDTIAPDWTWQIGNLNVTTPTSPYQRQGGAYPYFSTETFPPTDGLLVEPGPECSEGSPDARRAGGRFAGCLTERIVRRGQQNSGQFYCPMRYRFGAESFYEPPGVSTRFLESLTLDSREGAGAMTIDRWSGALRRYDMSRESIAEFQKFCSDPRGTLINAGSGHDNHAGDTAPKKSCLQYLVVNDTMARGLPK